MFKHAAGIFFLLSAGLFGAQLTQLKTHIELTSDPLVSLSILSHTLNTLGYKLQIDEITAQKSFSRIEGAILGSKPLNPATLSESLQDANMSLIYARMNQGKMELGINAATAVWNVPVLGVDEGMQLERSNSPYWFRIEGGDMIRIEPPYGGKWYPDVSVLDASMRVLYAYRSNKSFDEMRFPLPEGAFYLKISNTNGMKALKEGMWVESMSEGR